jgi:hypothetical protein
MADPVSAAAVASATAATKLLQTTLIVLYFTTGATTVKVDRTTKPKFEATKLWNLQTTSQIATENPNMCLSIGLQYIHEFDEVSTVTVRAYCICPEVTSNNDACFNQKALDEKNPRIQSLRTNIPTEGTILRLGPNSTLSNPSGDR